MMAEPYSDEELARWRERFAGGYETPASASMVEGLFATVTRLAADRDEAIARAERAEATAVETAMHQYVVAYDDQQRIGFDIALREAGKIATDLQRPDVLRLHCGEMTAQEMRTARAVVMLFAAKVRAIPYPGGKSDE